MLAAPRPTIRGEPVCDPPARTVERDGDGPCDADVSYAARWLLERLAAYRARFVDRVREVNAMTEREVMAAAASVARIVERASRHVEATKRAFAEIDGADGDRTVAGAIALQAQAMHRYRGALAARIAQQQAVAERAEQSLQSISTAADAVANLSHEAHILALNARIEASRLGDAGSGFAVIAGEMQRLSRQIADANDLIDGLTRELASVLPEMTSGVRSMRAASDALSAELERSAGQVEQFTANLRALVERSLRESDAASEAILASSHDALSHLQFQDAVAQGLLRMDRWICELQREAAKATGTAAELAAITPPVQDDMGDDTPVDAHNAGDVLLL
jgi:methyl-accepting chemotaxis protein